MSISAGTGKQYESPQNFKNGTPYDPATPFLDIYQNTKTLIHKEIRTLMFTAALFTTDKKSKQPTRLLRDEWIKQMCCD